MMKLVIISLKTDFNYYEINIIINMIKEFSLTVTGSEIGLSWSPTLLKICTGDQNFTTGHQRVIN